jgi:hypothetical protein
MMKVDLVLTGRYGWGIAHGAQSGGLSHPAWTVSEGAAGGLTLFGPVGWPPSWRQKSGGLGSCRRGATLLPPGRRPLTAPMRLPPALGRHIVPSQVAVPVEKARMRDVHPAAAHAHWAIPVPDPLSRAAVFAALRPALEALIQQAGVDSRLSVEARRVLRAVVRTRPEHTLALAELAARASTAKARVPVALSELETYGYLAQLAHIAPHLSAALPPHTRCTPGTAPTVESAGADTA